LMELFDNLKMYWRFARGLRSYARRSISLEEARQIIRRRMAQREESFLRIVRRAVFKYPKSPYLPLMRLAGCEYGDLEKMVKADGLECALLSLREAGVYVDFEEFKGRKPMVRGSQAFQVTTSDFENPYMKTHYQAETGGTTGAGRRIPMELDHLGEQAPQLMLARQAHGVLNAPSAVWRGPIPDATGIHHILRAVRYGRLPVKWYIADLKGDDRPKLIYRLLSLCFVNTLRLLSLPVPRPEPLRMDQAVVLARWAADILKTHPACCIQTPVGRALRICLAAQEAGIDLSGLVFMAGGEPLTPAKARVITANGARYFPTYAMYELGSLGAGCATPACSDDIHLSKDCYALITYPHTAPGGNKVPALNFSSILPTTPMVMINAQIDDYALVEDRPCGCLLGEVGYTQHISHIASYSKMVSEGVTFIGSDVVRILEEVLPARFGGSPLDYQLLEEEDRTGLTRVHLLVSPRIRLDDEEKLRDFFLKSLNNGPDSYSWARSLWAQGETLQVRRMEPFVTPRGKHLSLWRKTRRTD
jgi:hypothetical protein